MLFVLVWHVEIQLNLLLSPWKLLLLPIMLLSFLCLNKGTVRGHHSPPPITPASPNSPRYIPPHKRPNRPAVVWPTCPTYVSNLHVQPTCQAYVSTLRVQLSDHIIILIIYLR